MCTVIVECFRLEMYNIRLNKDFWNGKECYNIILEKIVIKKGKIKSIVRVLFYWGVVNRKLWKKEFVSMGNW